MQFGLFCAEYDILVLNMIYHMNIPGLSVLISIHSFVAWRTLYEMFSNQKKGNLLEQTFNVRAEVRSVSNFFLNHPFELIFLKFFPKTNRFSSLVTKPLRKFFWRTFFNFGRFLELIHLENRVFHTYISSNTAETLQSKDLAV